MSTSAFATDPFQTSSPSITSPANEFWNIYGIGWHLGGGLSGNRSNMSYGANTAWNEWDALKFAWTNDHNARTAVTGFVRDTLVNGVTTPANPSPPLVQPTGFVWSWSIYERWPDACPPGDSVHCDASHGGVGSFHFDQVPAYINGIHLLYLWSRDAAFLNLMLPRAEVVMDDYMLGVMQGATGLLVMPGTANQGTSTGRPSTYMDQIRSGHKDGWVNASFYSALLAMGDLEEAAGNASKALTYRNRAATFPAEYRAALWTGNRYAGWRDVNGVLHDAGYTYFNLPALVRGLPTPADADRVLEWLDSPATVTVAGARAGSTSVYQSVFAPRANTLPVPAAEWDGWSNLTSGPIGPYPYGQHFQNGGTFLWESYYDIMARLRYRHADDAHAKFQRMLTHMTTDSNHLAFCFPDWLWCNGTTRDPNDFNEHKGEIGTNGEFPESGLSVLPLLYGFMGVNADLQGLHVAPELPSALLSASASGVDYKGSARTIKVSRGQAVSQQEVGTVATTVGTSLLMQTFLGVAPFNEVGVLVGTYGVDGAAFTLSLESSANGGLGWVPVVTRQLTGVQNNAWIHMAVPPQPLGLTYRLTVRDPSTPLAWWRDPSSTVWGSAFSGGTLLTGDFAFRAVDAPQGVLLSQTAADAPDALNGTLGQVFNAAQPFDRATLHIGTYVTSTSGFTATLFRDNGEGWKPMARQVFKNVVDNSDVPMNFASMKPGRYYLEISDEVGTIAWYRGSTSNLGTAFWAAQNGVAQPGNRTFQLFRGQYRVEVPEKGVDTTVLAGNRYTMSN
ncbi:hypothetical protein [Corallococcus llansteffanensis]|uniref:Alpha-L-rhamnosidase six-hairpin glycosidase domain-containing protein n=1 Tax=Corallococcus llansteffanensis TaxID=2316731 RepID=A0A3A8PIA5_9BACT|nr:hypothetical protein [Corallococcus llansteffanensis]RKH56077.1 hypothetical protein D7V93_21085 [Corallococcus llansteffanensis]